MRMVRARSHRLLRQSAAAGLEGDIMKTSILALAVAGLLTSTAMAQSVGAKTDVNTALGVAPKTDDFIKESATSAMLEIEAAEIAEQKGNAEEKKFAGQMITDYTKTSADLKSMAPADKQSAIPTKLDDSSQKRLYKLRHAKPEDFASACDPMQVTGAISAGSSASSTMRA
jgi:putative membrane protein